MNKVRFILIGGFLGAGKTTTIKRLARAYIARGLKVGVVTNDQAENLVDTQTLRQAGFRVEEIPGACFCCAFNDLIKALERLTTAERPDIILGEPVGSCTDLSATVYQPLKDLYGDRCVVTPLAVLVDPHRASKILARDPQGGFSPKAAHIYETQLEEADLIVVNKSDTLQSGAGGPAVPSSGRAPAEDLSQLLDARYPGKPRLVVSARTGAGFEGLLAALEQQGRFGRHIAQVDYEVYAAGEAELGWLNMTVALQAAEPAPLDRSPSFGAGQDNRVSKPFDLDRLLLELAGRLHDSLNALGAEIAHLKMIALADGRHGIVNVVRNDAAPELSVAAGHQASAAGLILNARVCMDPEALRRVAVACLSGVCDENGITLSIRASQQFRPARPVPVHRYAQAV